MMTRVSVIIPTYRHREYVRATIESVFEQTLADVEVIVVNDGSPDDTADVLRPYIDMNRIRYFDQPNKGQAAARNVGLSKASGEFVAFLDDDDLWPPEKLAWQVAALDSDSSLVAIAGVAEFIDAEGRPTGRGQFWPSLTVENLFTANPLMSPGQTLIRTAALRSIGGFDERIWGADDWLLWFELARRGGFAMHDRIGLKYRLHAGNASHQARRLCAGSRAVLERQAGVEPAHRRRRRRAAYRMLYDGWGGRFVASFKSGLRHRRWSEARADLTSAIGLMRGVSDEPRLVWWLFRDLAPARLRHTLGGFRLTRSTR